MIIKINDTVMVISNDEFSCGNIGKVLEIGQTHDNTQLVRVNFQGIAEWCLLSELLVLSTLTERSSYDGIHSSTQTQHQQPN